jgi:hypothetical protein
VLIFFILFFEDVMELEQLKEALRAEHLAVGFKEVLPQSFNYTDSHQPLPIFSTRWGRGVLLHNGNMYDAIVGSYGTSHSNLKKQLQSPERSVGTFYYGYDSSTKTLYLEYGSDTTFDFKNSQILAAIIEAIQLSSGPLKDLRFN